MSRRRAMQGVTLLTLAVWALAPLARADDAVNPPAAPPKFRISKATTHITEPLTSDGRPDYVAWLNRKYSEGVTAENNAFISYAAICADWDAETKARYVAALGIERLPESPRFHDLNDKQHEQLFDLYVVNGLAPWNDAAAPDLGRYLDDHKPALDALAEAAGRDRYFAPLIRDENGFITSGYERISILAGIRNATWVLRARGIRSLAAGDVDGARRDIAALARIGARLQDSVFLIDRLVEVAIRSSAMKAYQHLAANASLTSQQYDAIIADIDALPPLEQIWSQIDTAERVFALAMVAKGSDGGWNDISRVPAERVERIRGVQAQVDWSRVMIDINKDFDRIVEALKSPSFREHARFVKLFEKEMDAIEGTFDARRPTESVSGTLREVFMGSMTRSQLLVDHYAVQHLLTRTALMLAAHRARHGEYPAALSDLAAFKDAPPPMDPYTDGKPLIYRRTEAGFILYSVGSDGEDDGGVDEMEEGDIVIEAPAKAAEGDDTP